MNPSIFFQNLSKPIVDEIGVYRLPYANVRGKPFLTTSDG
jgi:hypothetical protein